MSVMEPLTVLSDQSIQDFIGKLSPQYKQAILGQIMNELQLFVENMLEDGQKVTAMSFGKHQVRVNAEGNGFDILLEVKTNGNIDIEIRGAISQTTLTYKVTDFIGTCPPFKTFEELESN